MTIYEIPELVNEAHMSAIIPKNVMSGFKNTGIHPYNRNLFTDIDFASALITDRPLAEEPRDGTIQQPDHDANMEIDRAGM